MTTENNENKHPTHIISQVFDAKGDSKQARWMRIGAAWMHGDGKGMNLVLDALPTTGRLVLREWTPREDGEPADATQTTSETAAPKAKAGKK